jgi:GTP-binding protein
VDLPGYGYARGGRESEAEFEALTRAYFGRETAAGILLVDARHPGLDADRAAWRWLHTAAAELVIVATKIDKLSRAERRRALIQLESVFEDSVLPVSAVTGEGLDSLWKLIERLANSPNPPPNLRR